MILSMVYIGVVGRRKVYILNDHTQRADNKITSCCVQRFLYMYDDMRLGQNKDRQRFIFFKPSYAEKKNRFRNPTFKNIKWQSHWKHFEITFKLKFLKYFKFEELYAILFFSMKHGAIRRTLHKRAVKVVWYHCLIWIKHLIRIFIHVNFCCSGRKIYRC